MGLRTKHIEIKLFSKLTTKMICLVLALTMVLGSIDYSIFVSAKYDKNTVEVNTKGDMKKFQSIMK
jgi:hypothetical protein